MPHDSSNEKTGTEDKFDPSIKILKRITRVLLEEGGIGRTALSQRANISYSRLILHIEWLERKGLIALVIDRGKVKVVLTRSGGELAATLLERSRQ